MTPIHRFLCWYRQGYYRLCVHRSHRLRLPCFRAFNWDGYCVKHTNQCDYGPTPCPWEVRP